MRQDDLYVLLARGLGLIGDDDFSKLRAEPDQNIVSALKAKLSEGEVKRLDKTFMEDEKLRRDNALEFGWP